MEMAKVTGEMTAAKEDSKRARKDNEVLNKKVAELQAELAKPSVSPLHLPPLPQFQPGLLPHFAGPVAQQFANQFSQGLVPQQHHQNPVDGKVSSTHAHD